MIPKYEIDRDALDTLQPCHAGVTPAALGAAKRIIMLDGMRFVRRRMTADYDVAAFTAELARIIDQERDWTNAD